MSEADEIAETIGFLAETFSRPLPTTHDEALAIVRLRLGPDMAGEQMLDNIAERLLQLAQERRNAELHR